MGTTLNRATYERMLEEDLAWLETTPRTLEREHVIAIVKTSASHEYDRSDLARKVLAEIGKSKVAVREESEDCEYQVVHNQGVEQVDTNLRALFTREQIDLGDGK